MSADIVQPAAILFLANVPPDLPEGDIAGAVRECMPVRIQLEMAVPPQEKVKPDAYYNWMPRQGNVTLSNPGSTFAEYV